MKKQPELVRMGGRVYVQIGKRLYTPSKYGLSAAEANLLYRKWQADPPPCGHFTGMYYVAPDGAMVLECEACAEKLELDNPVKPK